MAVNPLAVVDPTEVLDHDGGRRTNVESQIHEAPFGGRGRAVVIDDRQHFVGVGPCQIGVEIVRIDERQEVDVFDLVRPAGEGRDVFGRMQLIYSLGRISSVTDVEILSDLSADDRAREREMVAKLALENE